MKTDSLEVGQVLRDNRRFTVPIYQRQYAWAKNRLAPFWDDLVSKAEESIEGPTKFQHYMGALILAPGSDGYRIGSVSSVQVVDGQQRLTTFYLFLAALKDIVKKKDYSDINRQLDVYLYNDERAYNEPRDISARIKLLPTPADREIFNSIISAAETIRVQHPEYFFQNGRLKSTYAPLALRAYEFFRDKIEEYLNYGYNSAEDHDVSEPLIDEGSSSTSLVKRRLNALAEALLVNFKLVTINLEEGDDAQVIFETLNSRGEPLLAMDLVRNNVFHRAGALGEGAEKLFEFRWKPFEQIFWKEDAPRARPRRPRIDHFLSYTLTARTGEETSLRELYAEYRAYVMPKGKPRFTSVESELDNLLEFKPTYEALETSKGDPDVAWLGVKLAIWEINTAYPVVFLVGSSDLGIDEKRAIYKLLYSYIVRRAICGLTPKNLNKNFARMAKALNEEGIALSSLRQLFQRQTGPAVRFPSNEEFTDSLVKSPLYVSMHRADRLTDILWELEQDLRTKFQINEIKPKRLSIEHILPQSWEQHWLLEDGRKAPETGGAVDDAMDKAIMQRRTDLHTIGNLTLITTELNSSFQNQDFEKKRERLAKSLLALNVNFAETLAWTHDALAQRSTDFALRAVDIWPSI